MADDNSASEKALDLLVHGPLGFALYVRDTVPSFLRVFVTRGRSELAAKRRQVGDQVSSARSVGAFAVNVAGPKVREQLRSVQQLAEQAFTGLIVPSDGSPVAPTEAAATPAREAGGEPAVDPGAKRAAAAALAIPDYDELSASQVVERLEGLGADELAAVRAYEEAHRDRRTILFKIDQLST